jgi:hypothetical protein
LFRAPSVRFAQDELIVELEGLLAYRRVSRYIIYKKLSEIAVTMDYAWLLALPLLIVLSVYLHRKERAKKGRPPTAEEIDDWEAEQW